MDTDLIALKIQRAIGQQVYLISIVFVVGVFAAIWLVNLAAKPVGDLLAYAVAVARDVGGEGEEALDQSHRKILERDDEAGQLARLFLHCLRNGGAGDGAPGASPADART